MFCAQIQGKHMKLGAFSSIIVQKTLYRREKVVNRGLDSFYISVFISPSPGIAFRLSFFFLVFSAFSVFYRSV
jgi:hypothetical protein